MGTHHSSGLITSFFSVNVVRVTTSISSRPSIIVGGPIVATTIFAASRVNDQLILSLGALPGNMTWLTALEAQSILRTQRCSSGRRRQSSWPWWWWRHVRCNIRRPRNRNGRHGHTVWNPDATLLSYPRRRGNVTVALQ